MKAIALLAAIVMGSVLARGEDVQVVEDKITIKRTLQTFTIKMVKIPAGEVEMPPLKQDQEPHKVQIKPLWMSRTEITWGAYDPYCLCQDLEPDIARQKVNAKLRPSKKFGDPGYGLSLPEYAARSVHPHAGVEYCKWLSDITGRTYRIPTEAEWEYACRAGKPVENLSDKRAHAQWLKDVASFADNSQDNTGEPVLQPGGGKQANPWGLHDMLGNIAEWVVDENRQYVLKGGSFLDEAKDVHSRARVRYNESLLQMRNPQDPKSIWWLSDCKFGGFRIVRED